LSNAVFADAHSGVELAVGFGCVKACKDKMTLTAEFAKAAAIASRSRGGKAVVLGRLSCSLPAKRIAKLHIRLNAPACKGLKGLKKGIQATLVVELKLGKAKKATKHTETIVLLPPAASKPPKAK
jgi:hypothetical protein